MSKIISFLVAAVIFVSAAAPINANGTKGNNYTMEVENNSSYVVMELYASNRDDSHWGSNRLRVPIKPGSSVIIDIDDYSGYCIYDLKAVGSNGSYWTRYDINVCEEYWWTLVD